MRFSDTARTLSALLVFLGFSAGIARALVTLNDGTDKIFVTGTFAMGVDSNIGASSKATGDTTYSAGLALDYQRRAGLVGLTANAGYNLTNYLKNTTYNSLSPSYSIELDKNTGRMTGALTMSAAESSQADAAANVRDVSWSYNIGLNVRYPVIERYSLTASVGYGFIDYTQTGGQPLVNLSNYTANVGLFYILNEQRDLFFSYRFRFEPSSASTSDTDNALMFGVSGKIYGEINGSLSVGYQVRTPHGFMYNGEPLGNEGSMTASGSLSWAANKKLNFTGSISKDFTTTSLDATTDTTAVSLDASYAMNARLSASTGVGAGTSLFLGPLGRVPNTNTQRRDYYFNWNASVSYSMGEHLHASLAYGFFKNWSNLGLATFVRNNLTLSLSSRW